MKESILRYGVTAGVIISMYMALLYAAGMDILANWWFSVLVYPISIGLICYFTIQLRNSHELEAFRYRQTFIALLSMFMIATLVSTLWNILLFNVVDKTLAKELSERILKQTAETMENWGAPEASIKETLKEMRDLPTQFKPMPQLIAWLKGGLFMAIISAICASFIKRKEQPFNSLNV